MAASAFAQQDFSKVQIAVQKRQYGGLVGRTQHGPGSTAGPGCVELGSDDNAYDAWLDLYADDALYWVPCNADDVNPTRQISIYYDNRERLEERITRLKSGAAHAQEPG